jgi:hypothetical protein
MARHAGVVRVLVDAGADVDLQDAELVRIVTTASAGSR